jgi:hypothetical protein
VTLRRTCIASSLALFAAASLSACGDANDRDTSTDIEVTTDTDTSDSVPDAQPDTSTDIEEGSDTGDTALDAQPDTSTDIEEAADSADSADTSDTIPAPLAALPPWLAYCDGAACDAYDPVVLAVCPEATPSCLPTGTATVLPSIDGHRITAIAFLAALPEGHTLRVVSGQASFGGPIVTAYAPRVEVRSDVAIQVTYYDLPLAAGDTLALDFQSTSQTSDVLDSVFYRHAAWDTGTAATELHTRGQATIRAERAATGITSEKVHAFFMPTELAAVQGEGNFSYGDGRITSNYGNPPYATALGGILPVAFPRFAHECAHELFDEVRASYPGNYSCLNEGVADALAFVVGSLPEVDFGPIGLRGDDFDDGCADLNEIHDVGNCPLWHAYRAGLLTEGFMRGVFQPGRVLDFDSCDLHSDRTGNMLFVLFAEAASDTPELAPIGPVLDAMGVPHAASYAAALAALGLSPR